MATKPEYPLSANAGDPRFCDIVIATRCVLRCRMCKAWQGGDNPHEITLDEAKRFVQSLSEFVKFPLEINVMGGEPLLKEWCLDLCDFISEKGLKSIISTNAYLIDEAMAKRIAGSKLSVLAISLESLKPRTHDFYRGVDGTFAKVMNAVRYLDKYCKGRLAITVLTIIMEKNLEDILELADWVNGNDLFVNISFLALLETGLVHPRDNWFKRPEYSQIWPQDTAKVHRLIDELIMLKKKGYKIWNPVSQLEAFKAYYVEPEQFMRETPYRIHDYIIDLDENGVIYLSGEPLGNIREDDAKRLWFSGKAAQIREAIDRRGPGKRCCVVNFVCAFPPDDKSSPQDPALDQKRHQELGFSYFAQKQIEEAVAEFNQALKINPRNEHAHHGLGVCYQGSGQYDMAVAEFNQALKINPRNEHAHHGLGLCFQERRQYDKAMEKFKESIAINPDNEHVRQSMGFCYKDLKQYDMAVAEFNQALKINPRNEHAHHGLGLCFQERRQYDKAMEKFKESIAINPDNERAHYGMASCYESLGEFAKAVLEFTEALRLNPDCEQYHQGMASCYESLGEFDRAIEEFKQVLKINPENEYAPYCLAACYDGLKQRNDAFERILEIDTDNMKCLFAIAGVYYKQRRYKEASRVFRRILKKEPDNPEALRYLRETQRPVFCVVEVSHKCMFKCKMCHYGAGAGHPREVSIDDLYRFVAQLKDLAPGPFEMNISGGEPLLKEGILDLVEFIAREGFRFSLVTNGYLIHKDAAKRIADSGLNFLAISLDSLEEKTHDYLRGVKGAHRKVMEAIGYFLAYRGQLQNLTLQTIIMGPNLEGVLDIAHWAQQKQLSTSFMALTRPNAVPIDPAWYKKEEFSFLWPRDPSRVQRVIDDLIKLKKTGYRIDNPVGQLERFKLYFADPERFVRETPCSLGEDIIHVNPQGDAHICCEMDPIGNIKEGDICAMWDAQKAQDIRERIKLCKRNCAEMVNCYREGS